MTKNPQNLGKKLLALVALATLFALSLSGCKNFMKSDDDVKETMQQEVEVANAPEVSVRVQPSSDSLGSVTPNGQAIFKVNVPSTVLASEVAGGFIKWAAFYSGDMGTEVADAVTFTDAKAKETPVTLLVNRPDVVIQAMFEKRPQVTYYFPDPLNGDAYTNSPIRITFSKPIDPASLTTTVEGKVVNNITFTEYFAGITNEITTKKYGAGSLSTDGKVIVYKNTVPMSPRCTMTIKVAKAVRDTSGLEMADDYSFNFKVGTSEDKDPPTLGDIATGFTDSYEFNASDAAARRITASQGPIYVRLRGTDVGAGIVSATITPTLTKYDDAGNNLGSVTYAAQTIPWIDDTGNTKTSFSVADLTAGSADDGLLTLAIVLTDGNENSTNPPATYNIVRDTMPPPVDPAQLARITTSGGYGGSGFYNRDSTVTVSNPTPLIDKGFAGNDTVPRLRSSVVQYRVSMNLSDFSTAPEGNWVTPGSPGYTDPTIALKNYTGPDGSAVPIYVQFRDDLKNASAPVTLKTIPVDNNAPTGGSISIANATASNGLKFVKVGSIDYTIKATDGISGVAKYAINTTGSTPADGEWTTCSSGADGTLTLTGSHGLIDGKNTLYAWFQDGAGNKTSTAVTDTVIYDVVKPTVSDFYLRETRNDSFTVKPKTNDEGTASQYSKDQSFYFMFIASDNASGFSTFTYSDDKGSTSDPIPMQTGISAGSGDYKVSGLNVAQLATKDGLPTQVLVTGILTIPANNSEHKLTVKVKDGAGNENDYVTSNDSNTVIFDNMVPEITSYNCETGNGYYLTPDKTKLYTNLDNPKVQITAKDVPNGTNKVSGLMDAILSCTTGNWSATSPVTFDSRKESYESGTVTAILTVGSSETATISATPRDYAGNLGTTSSLTLIKDQTPPTLALYLYPPSPVPTGANDAKVIKKVDSTETIDCSVATHDFTEFYIGMIGYDGGSGINGERVHAYEVYRRTKSGDEKVGLGNLIISANEKITPDSSYYDKSAVWLVRVKAMDNVGNVMTQYESVGYTYDITPPTIDESSVKVTLSSAEDAPDISKKLTLSTASGMCPAGTYYFIPASAVSGDATQAVCVQIKATDCPTGGDENGSGLASVKDGLTSYPINSASGETHNTTSSQSEADGPYVVIANGTSSQSWNFAGVALMQFKPTVTDRCGNYMQVSAPFYIVLDGGLPTTTATPTFTPSGKGKLAGVTYLSPSSTMSFTPNDPETGSTTTYQRRASGTCGYVLSTSPVVPIDPATKTIPWQTCSDGSPVTVSASDLGTAIGKNTTTDLYLYLIDNAGNQNRIALGSFRIDETNPTLSGIKITCPSGTVHDVKGITYVTDPAFNLYASAADDTNGSGVASYTVETRTIPLNSTSWGSAASVKYDLAAEGEILVSGAAYSLAEITDQQFRITLADKVGNTASNATSLATSTLEVRLDNEKPTASATDIGTPYLDDGTTTYISDKTTLTLSLVDKSTNSRVPSGIRGWLIQKAGSAAPTKDSTWTTDMDNVKAAKALFDLVSPASTAVDLYAIDNVDNVSAVCSLHSGNKFMVDADAPDVTIDAKVSSNKGADGSYYVSATPKVSFTASDKTGGSGLNKYLYSTETTMSADDINTKGKNCAGTVVGETVSGFVADSAKTVYLYVSDRAGNVTQKATVDHPSKIDANAPVIDHAQAWCESQKRYTTVDSAGVMTVKINYLANAELESGIKTIKIAGDLADSSGAQVSQNGSGPIGSTVSYDGSAATKVVSVSLNSPITLIASGYLTVSNVSLNSDNASYTVTVIDAAGNESSGTPYTIKKDATAPSGLTLTLSDGDITTNTTYSSLIARATGNFTEAESQLYSLTFSGDILDFDTDSNSPTVVIGSGTGKQTYTKGGTTYKLTISGKSIVLDPPPSGSSVAYEVTGIKIDKKTSDGERSVSVSFTNTAELSASASYSIILDTTPPTIEVSTSTGNYPYTITKGSTTADTEAKFWSPTGTAVTIFLASGDGTGSGSIGYSIDGGETTKVPLSTSSTKNIGPISNGQSIQTVDNVGNKSYAIKITVTEDSTPPTFTLTPKTGGVPATALAVTTADNTGNKVYSKGTELDFDLSAEDNTGGSGPGTYKLNTTDLVAVDMSPTIKLTASAAGTAYDITVLDNVSNASKELGLTVYQDTAGPKVTVASPGSDCYQPLTTAPSYYTAKDSLIFKVTAKDDAGVDVCTVTGATVTKTTAITGGKEFEVTIPANPTGTNVTISVTDALGTPSAAYSLTLTQDKIPPVVTLTPPGSGVNPDKGNTVDTRTYYTKYSNSTDTTSFTLKAIDTWLQGYTINGVAGNPLISGTDHDISLAQGTNTIVVSDYVGNSVTYTVTLVNDAAPPTFTFTPTGNCTSNATTTVSNADVNLGTLYTTDDSLPITLTLLDTGDSGVKSYSVGTSETDHGAGTVAGFTLPANSLPQTITVTDNSLNVSNKLAVTVVQDKVGPAIVKTDPASGFFYNGTTYFTQGTSLTFTVKGTDAAGVKSCVVSGGSGSVTPAPTGNDGEWKVTLPVSNTVVTYTISMTDMLNNTTASPVSIKVVQDNTPIAITGISYQSPDIVLWVNEDNGSGIDTPTIIGGGAYNKTTSTSTVLHFNGITTDGSYTVKIPDKVGNTTSSKFCFVAASTYVAAFANMPTSWTCTKTGSSKYTFSNLNTMQVQSYTLYKNGIDKVSDNPNAGPSSLDNLDGSSGGTNYVLTLYHDKNETGISMTIAFTVTDTGSISSSASIFGNPLVGERLPDAAVVSAIRKESFERARSSSSTNLPVWYSEVGSVNTSAKTERSGTASVNAVKSVAQNLATPARTGKTRSVEDLHAAALSGMRATAVNERKDETVGVSPEKATVTAQGGIADTVVMTAPEGSPAFVAYARGVAALTSEQNGSVAVTIDRSSFMVSGGTKPAGLWERLLAFFGVRSSGSDLAENF